MRRRLLAGTYALRRTTGRGSAEKSSPQVWPGSATKSSAGAGARPAGGAANKHQSSARTRTIPGLGIFPGLRWVVMSLAANMCFYRRAHRLPKRRGDNLAPWAAMPRNRPMVTRPTRPPPPDRPQGDRAAGPPRHARRIVFESTARTRERPGAFALHRVDLSLGALKNRSGCTTRRVVLGIERQSPHASRTPPCTFMGS